MNERKYCVYMHKNKINDKVYIGATCMKPKRRWANGKGYKGNKEFYKEILEYGWDNFEHIVLEDNLNYVQSKEKEVYYISLYKGNCYNKTKGGEQGKIILLTNKEYEQSFRDNSKKYYYSHENYRKNKINKIIEMQQKDKETTNKKAKDYYYKSEKYHQYKIEYQRKYRQEHRKTNRPYNKKIKVEL